LKHLSQPEAQPGPLLLQLQWLVLGCTTCSSTITKDSLP
jgi:hypothetical protein